MPTAQDLIDRTHSYRNHEPQDYIDALENSSDEAVMAALGRLEGGRFEPLLATTSKFFFKLDRDEMETFTRRNPDLVRWMSVWNRLHGYNPYAEWFELAGDLLDQGEWNVPPFERRDVRQGRTLLKDLYTRRRSYREFTPGEIMEIADDHHDITEGAAREMELYDREVLDDIEEWPIEVYGKSVARNGILPRIEAGRFQPMLRAAHKVFGPLDPDEGREFGRRNPGIVMWLSAWGFTEDQIYGEDQLYPLSNVDWPLVPEV